ncbi:hypothetical protein SAM19_04502 [Brevibacillus laterosporus]|nr:hypothetical protein [Brevibacillus laterosporus]
MATSRIRQARHYLLKDVFFAELQEDGSVIIDKKGNTHEYN